MGSTGSSPLIYQVPYGYSSLGINRDYLSPHTPLLPVLLNGVGTTICYDRFINPRFPIASAWKPF